MKVAQYCLDKQGATESYPFGPDITVMKVQGKIFALMPAAEEPKTINLKCDPVRAAWLRQQYHEIIPGYHMNKQHWNTLDLTGALPDELIYELIDHSYNLIKK